MQNLKALIVDGNKASLKNLLTVVKHGVGIKESKVLENVAEALKYIKNNQELDLIFIDNETVSEGLFDFVESCKQMISNSDLKFILLANNTNKSFLFECANHGISSFILKPYIYNTVVSKVKKVCASKSQRKAKRLVLLDPVTVVILHKDHKIPGAMVDVSSTGCLILTSPLGKFNLDIYDKLIVNIPFNKESAKLKSQLIRMERDTSSDDNKISSAFVFEAMDPDSAMQFAKLWAFLMGHNSK